jgi:alpha-tubulin suppressor-like RCC1 family protein
VAGYDHTCARTDAGAVWCWGASDKGQTGLGTRERRPKPARIEALEAVIDLAAGADHTCARTATDTWCWGDDGAGQLGDGAGGARSTPNRSRLVDDAVAVAAGYTATCATRRDGAAVCWGRDDVRDTYVFNAPQPWAPPVPPLRALTLGTRMGCGLSDQRVDCFGSSLFGALGPDPRPDAPEAHTEALGGLAVEARAVAIGDGHTLVLGADGAVTCFGANPQGQCGVSPEAAGEVARHVVLTDAVAVAAGEHHSCAVRADGSVWCWGGNRYGQLGRPGSDPRPAAVPGIQGATGVIAGWSHTCALTPDGLRCWGRDHRGQLGRGAPLESHRPMELQP